MFFFAFLLISSPSSSEEALQKTLEFQYQQRLEKLQKENESLRTQIKELQTKITSSEQCSSIEISNPKTYSKTQTRISSEEERTYRSALSQAQAENWDEALLNFESFVHQFPKSSLAPNAIYWMAQIYLQKNEKALAKSELERILTDYPKSDRAKRAQARLESLNSEPVLKESLRKEP